MPFSLLSAIERGDFKAFEEHVHRFQYSLMIHQTDQRGRNVLDLAVKHRNVEMVRTILSLDIFISYTSALCVAAKCGYDDIVALILPYVSVYSRDGNGCTALHLATRYGHLKVVERLLEEASDLISIQNNCPHPRCSRKQPSVLRNRIGT